MNTSLISITLLAVVGVSLAAYIPSENFDDMSEHQMNFDSDDTAVYEPIDLDETHGIRQRRATCDLLSISLPWGSLNHSACAAHCISMRKGFRGGRCMDGVCHCRR